jgi:hypothetical protein
MIESWRSYRLNLARFVSRINPEPGNGNDIGDQQRGQSKENPSTGLPLATGVGNGVRQQTRTPFDPLRECIGIHALGDGDVQCLRKFFNGLPEAHPARRNPFPLAGVLTKPGRHAIPAKVREISWAAALSGCPPPLNT